MNKKTFLSAILCLGLCNMMAQTENDIYVEFTIPEDASNVAILAYPDEGEPTDGIWVDLNNNHAKDAGESFAEMPKVEGEDKLMSITPTSKVFRIYGPVKEISCNAIGMVGLDISHNLMLKRLYCVENTLTEMDLSKHVDMEELDVAQGMLTSLNVSNCPKLTYLNCSLNNLSAVDVSHNPLLETLYVHSNQLSELDVTHNTNLRVLEAYENNITSLDLSKCTNLIELNVSKTSLTNLDLSQNASLRLLSVSKTYITSLNLDVCTQLISLDAYGNALTTIDMTNNNLLQAVLLSSNQLQHISFKKLPNLRFFEIYSNSLSETTTEDIINKLPDYSSNGSGELFAINTSAAREKNVFNSATVAIAKKKGWKVFDYMNGKNQGYNLYEGSPVTFINQVTEGPLQIKVNNNEVTLKLTPAQIGKTVTIYNGNGMKVVPAQKIRSLTYTQNINALPAGVYLVKVDRYTLKFIK